MVSPSHRSRRILYLLRKAPSWGHTVIGIEYQVAGIGEALAYTIVSPLVPYVMGTPMDVHEDRKGRLSHRLDHVEGLQAVSSRDISHPSLYAGNHGGTTVEHEHS